MNDPWPDLVRFALGFAPLMYGLALVATWWCLTRRPPADLVRDYSEEPVVQELNDS